MAEEKKEIGVLERRKMHKLLLQTRLGRTMTSKEDDVLWKRQAEEEEDPFSSFYTKETLAVPPFAFYRLYQIYEQSDMLQECIEAMVQNVDGFGYQMQFLGEDVNQNEPDAAAQLIRAKNFFDYANEEQSWTTIRKLAREDFEVYGNAGFEFVRNLRGDIALTYHVPFRTIRVGYKLGNPVTVPVSIMRDGKEQTIKVRKYFRRYAQIRETTGRRLRWFKSFGDPRILDAWDGEFKASISECREVASEILHFKYGAGHSRIYGIPRWMGAVLDVMGRRSSQYVNCDLFDSQGIPPMAVLVSGGTLTDESIAELEAIIRGMRGVEKWNRILLLESNFESTGIEDKGTAKIELKNLAEYRKEDQMFAQYLASTEKTIRHRYRLPPLYVGAAESFTHATAKSSKEAAEEQVFIPERQQFDELVNAKIVRPELKVTQWKYKTMGPRIVGAEEISSGVSSFVETGAFTVNHAIQLANEAFGLQMSKFKETWADYPLPMVMELLKAGRLKDLDSIADKPPKPIVTAPTVPGQRAIPGVAPKPKALPAPKLKPALPAVTKKILESDMFAEEEKELYRRLTAIRHAIESREEDDVLELQTAESE